MDPLGVPGENGETFLWGLDTKSSWEFWAIYSGCANATEAFVSPATGGLTVPEGIHWLTAAVQEANKNRSRVSVLAGKGEEAAVINILSMPTHGVLSQKLLHQVRSSVLLQS